MGGAFADTDGPGTNFTSATCGSWEAGVYDYKVLSFSFLSLSFSFALLCRSNLPPPFRAIVNNATFGLVHHDDTIVASWAYNPDTRYMVSFDDTFPVVKKAEYINAQRMGGAMWWELSADKPMNVTDSLARTIADVFETCGGLEQCPNVLEFPYSKYQNLREGMPGQ